MRALILLAAAGFVLALSAAPQFARPAWACSPAPGYDPVSSSDAIVAGRILGWERTGGMPSASGVPIRLRVAVDWAFKGAADAEVSILDNSLQPNGRWGYSGLCQPFTSEPTGEYVVLGLDRRNDGAYSTSLLQRFAFGAEPGSAAYQEAVEQLAESGEATLNLAEPRPCIPEAVAAECTPERRALWEADAAAWADRGVVDAGARLHETIVLRAGAGDPMTLAALAREAGRPYVQVRAVRYLAEPVRVIGFQTVPPAEFVEIVNLGGADQDLTGWTVQSPDRGVTLPLPDGRLLRPRESCRMSRVANPGGPACGAPIDLPDVWPDSGGRVLLVDAEGEVRVDIRYSADPYDQPPPPNLEGIRLPQ